MTNHRPDTTYSGSELCRRSASEIVDLLRRGDVGVHELIDASADRTNVADGPINAMVTQCVDRAHRWADDRLPSIRVSGEGDPGWLGGLPVGIKDLSAVEGVRTTSGTVALADFVPTVNDPIVDIIEGSGGVVIGKTNTPEMGAGGNTFNAVFGSTRNPWDTRKNAGGSSGGSAAALATGQVWLAQGSDLGGSLRTPAAYCGVVGMRPTPGRVFGGPMNAGFSGESLTGPMARSVTDCALFLDAMAGYDNRAPLGLPAPHESFTNAVNRADPKVRIAWAPTLGGFAPVESEIEAIMRSALEAVERGGAAVEDACPELPELHDTYVTLRAMNWASLTGRLPETIQRHFKKTLADNIALGHSLTGTRILDAGVKRTVIYHTMREFLDDFDVLACAVVGLEPTDIEVEYPTEVAGQPMAGYMDWLRFSYLATTAGLPAISVPCGFTASGMPVGIQLIGPPRGDAIVLATARVLEQAVDLGTEPIDPIVRRGADH
ncbi:MAG: amidase [Acidimicrobiales bacterium]